MVHSGIFFLVHFGLVKWVYYIAVCLEEQEIYNNIFDRCILMTNARDHFILCKSDLKKDHMEIQMWSSRIPRFVYIANGTLITCSVRLECLKNSFREIKDFKLITK